MISARAVRYRRLAVAADDRAKADPLLKLAAECDRLRNWRKKNLTGVRVLNHQNRLIYTQAGQPKAPPRLPD
jgi:hypothetical protein